MDKYLDVGLIHQSIKQNNAFVFAEAKKVGIAVSRALRPILKKVHEKSSSFIVFSSFLKQTQKNVLNLQVWLQSVICSVVAGLLQKKRT